MKALNGTHRTRFTAKKGAFAAPDYMGRWATAYVLLAAVMSMGLNALANGLHSPPDLKWAAWGMGALIPVLVLLLGKVAGLAWRRGQRPMAKVIGTIGTAVLLLSVFHGYQSICLLTGSHWLLSAALAVGIDLGMVGCEVVATVNQ
jgi:hypothetical protein